MDMIDNQNKEYAIVVKRGDSTLYVANA